MMTPKVATTSNATANGTRRLGIAARKLAGCVKMSADQMPTGRRLSSWKSNKSVECRNSRKY